MEKTASRGPGIAGSYSNQAIPLTAWVEEAVVPRKAGKGRTRVGGGGDVLGGTGRQFLGGG